MSIREPKLGAELFLRFSKADGVTQLVDRSSRAPLKLNKTFQQPDGRADCIMMDVSPGMMAGDRYRIELELGAGTDVFMTNQSSTKVHPCAANPAEQDVRLVLGRGARLDYRPEPVMLYADGALRSRTEVQLEAGSMLLLSEVLGPGRWLRGEAFQYRFYDTKLSVSYRGSGVEEARVVGSGRSTSSSASGLGVSGSVGSELEPELIFYNRQVYEPGAGPSGLLYAPGVWRSGTHLGTLLVFSDRLGSRHKEEWLEWASSESRSGSAIGISLTHKYGLALSVVGSTAWELQSILDEARTIALGW